MSIECVSSLPQELSPPSAELRVESVACAIDGHTIVRDVSFTAAPGTMTAIIGVNGAGKTTLLRTLAGITRPASGTVRIDGHNLHAYTPRQRAKRVGFVAQEEVSSEDLLVSDLIALGRLPHTSLWSMASQANSDIVRWVLRVSGLEEKAECALSELSGGQRRRAFIARGVAQQTSILLLDEPTNQLDVHHQLSVIQFMRGLGATIIATIHDLDLAMSYFDHIVLLDAGTQRIAGTPAEVLTSEQVRDVFDVTARPEKLDWAVHHHLIVDSL